MNLQNVYSTKRQMVSDFASRRKDMNRVLDCVYVKPKIEKDIRSTNRTTLLTVHAVWAMSSAIRYVHAHTCASARDYRQTVVWCRRHFGTRVGRGWVVVPMWWPKPKVGVVLYAIIISEHQAKMTTAKMICLDQI